MRFAAIVEGEIQWLPAGNRITHPALTQPVGQAAIVVSLTAPARLHPAEEGRHGLALVNIIEHQGAPLEGERRGDWPG